MDTQDIQPEEMSQRLHQLEIKQLDLEKQNLELSNLQLNIQKSYDELKSRLSKKTAELKKSNARVKQEISSRQQAEERMQQSEELFWFLTEDTHHVIFRARFSPPKFEYVSPSVTAFSGYTPAEHYANPYIIEQMIYPDDKKLLRDAISSPDNSLKTLVVRWIKKDGSIIWTENRAMPICDESGKVVGIDGIVRDITEQKKAEEALRESEQFSTGLLEHAPNPVFVQNPDTSIKYVNPAWEKLTGYSKEEVIGKKLPYPHWPKEKANENIADYLNTLGQNRSKIIRLFQKKNGEHFWVELSSNAQKDTDGIVKYQIANWIDITERKQAEEALKESEGFNSSLLKFAPNPIVVINPDTSIRYVNPAFEKLMGYSSSELIGIKSPYPYNTEQNRLADRIDLGKALQENNLARLERLFQKKNGEIIIVEVAGIPKLDNAGKLDYFIVNWMDITERKQGEMALQESEEKYRSLVNNVRLGISRGTPGPRGKYLEFNKALEEITGYSREELLAMEINDLYVYPEERKEVIDEATSASGKSTKEFMFKKKDGSQYIAAVTLTSVKDSQGNILYFDGILEDITERKLAEDKLRESEKRFHELADLLPVVTFESDLQGNLIYYNAAVMSTFGYTREEVQSNNLFNYISPEDRERTMLNIRRVVSGENRGNNEYLCIKKDGSYFPCLVQTAPIKNIQGELTGIRGVLVDISNQKRIEEGLRASEEFSSSLLANSPNPISLIGPDYAIKYINPALEKLTGFSPADLVGTKPPYPYWLESDALQQLPVFEYNFKQAIKFTLERPFRKKNGDLFWVEITGIPIKMGKEEQISILSNWIDITERKKAEEKLKKSEEFSAMLRDKAPNPIVAINPDSTIGYVNPAFENLSGFSRTEVLGLKPPFPWWSEDDKELPGQVFKATEDTSLYRIERCMRTKSGKEFWVELSAVPIVVNGEFKFHLSNWIDITERKKVEEALRDSEEFSNNILDKAPHPIVVISPDNSIKYINPALIELTGFSSEELLGKKFPYPYWPEKDVPDILHFLEKTRKAGIGNRIERCFQKKNGQLFWVEITSNTVKLQGEDGYNLGNWIDITERKLAEEKLRESEEFSTTLLTNCPSPIIVTNPDYSIRYVNPALEKLTGYSKSELIATNLPRPWWKEDTVRQFTELNYLPNTGEEGNAERCHRNKNGETFWAEINVKPVKDENGVLKYTLGNWIRSTERKKAEEALKDSVIKFRALFYQSQDGIILTDDKGIIRGWNATCEKITGVKENEVIDKLIWEAQFDLTPRERKNSATLEMLQSQMNLIFTTKQSPMLNRITESEIQRPDGTICVLQTVLFLIETRDSFMLCTVFRDISEYKKAEEQIRYQAMLVENVSDAIISTDLNFNIRSWNKAAETIYGWQEEEVVGKKLAEVTHLDFLFGSNIVANAKLFREGNHRGEIKQTLKDGRCIHILGSISLIKDSSGKPTGIVMVNRDITERMKAEEALKASEEFSSSLLNNSPNPIILFNPDSSIRYVNPAMEKLTGYSSIELVGIIPPYPYWPEEARPELQSSYDNMLKTGKQLNADKCFRKKNGELLWVEAITNPVRMGNEKELSRLANWIDITERKKAEEALQISEYKYWSLVNNLKLGIIRNTPGPRGRHLEVNKAMETITGFSREELLAMNVSGLYLHPEEREKISQEIASSPEWAFHEIWFKKKDGSPILVAATTSPVRDNGGNVLYFDGILEDITEKKRLTDRISQLYEEEKRQRKELEEEAKARGMFIDVLAHDLRTPLTPILASTSMLQDLLSSDPDSVQMKLVNNINSGSQTLAQRLEELLDLARFSRGTFKINPRLVDTKPYLENVISRFRPTIDQLQQQLTVEIEKDLPATNIDPSKLEQVIVNLLSNASKFSLEKGKILFKASVQDNGLLVEVKDEGIGIPFAEHSKLFQPYHRVEQDRQFPGLGLGLAVARQIIESHGGKIWVTSQPGKGSTFSFSIPLQGHN